MTHAHYYTNWLFPFFDNEKDRFIDTCSICGKIKYQNRRYIGRKKDGSRKIVMIYNEY